MKKTFVIGLVSILILLSACSSAANALSETQTAPGNSDQTANLDSDSTTTNRPSTPVSGAEELTIQLKLLLGSYKLEGTSNEITAESAAQLLTLWKAVRSLGESDTTAVEEIEAVYNQIEETMTPEQVADISVMNLSREDMASIMQDMGIEGGNFGNRFGDLSPEMQATAQAARESGQFPEGGFPGGGVGGGPGGGQGRGQGEGFTGGAPLVPPGDANSENTTQWQRVSSGIPSFLLDAYIEFLEGKISE